MNSVASENRKVKVNKIKTGQSQDFIGKLSRRDLPTAFIISTQLF